MNLQEKETVDVEVKFKATIVKDFLEEFSKIVDHKIDCLIDLNEFPEIKSVYDANLNIVATKSDDNCHCSEDLVNIYDSKKRVVKCLRSFRNGNYIETFNIYNHPDKEEPIASCTLYSSPEDPRNKFIIRNPKDGKVQYACYGGTLTRYLYNVPVTEALVIINNNGLTDMVNRIKEDIDGDFVVNELQLHYKTNINFKDIFLNMSISNTAVLSTNYSKIIEDHIKDKEYNVSMIIFANSKRKIIIPESIKNIPNTDSVDFKDIEFRNAKILLSMIDNIPRYDMIDLDTGSMISLTSKVYKFKDKSLDNVTYIFADNTDQNNTYNVEYKKEVDHSKEIYEISPNYKGETVSITDIIYSLNNDEYNSLLIIDSEININKEATNRFEDFVTFNFKDGFSNNYKTIFDINGNEIFNNMVTGGVEKGQGNYNIRQVVSEPVSLDVSDYTVEIEYNTSLQPGKVVPKMYGRGKRAADKFTELYTYKDNNLVCIKRYKNDKLWQELINQYNKEGKLNRSRIYDYDGVLTEQ